MEALWYEILIEVHGAWNDSEVERDRNEAYLRANEIVGTLAADKDLAWWKVSVLPHWCDPHFECECSQHRESEEPYRQHMGQTINF